MKRKILSRFLAIHFLPIVLLSSCGIFVSNKRIQKFVEGSFIGTLYQNDKILNENVASLEVENISKEEFDDASGLNVVEDINGGNTPYYHLTLKILNVDDNEWVFVEFKNLSIRPDEICKYIDDNDIYFYPQFCQETHKNFIYYTIRLKNDFLPEHSGINFRLEETD